MHTLHPPGEGQHPPSWSPWFWCVCNGLAQLLITIHYCLSHLRLTIIIMPFCTHFTICTYIATVCQSDAHFSSFWCLTTVVCCSRERTAICKVIHCVPFYWDIRPSNANLIPSSPSHPACTCLCSPTFTVIASTILLNLTNSNMTLTIWHH